MVIGSAAALAQIKEFEGLRLAAYRCPAGYWTIGYGSRVMPSGRQVRRGDTLTVADADLLFSRMAAEFSVQLAKALAADRITVTQGQFDALLSFAYNLGLSALVKSTLWRKLKAGDRDGAAAEFPRWVYAKGKVEKGLVRRRFWEQKQFLS